MSQQAIGWTILIVIGTFLLWSAIWTEAQQSGWRYVLGAAGPTLDPAPLLEMQSYGVCFQMSIIC